MTRESEYISLKEAAKISGYSPDYIGQLIRSGKIHGKQVFLNVAWMTTREALEAYAKREKGETSTWKEWIAAYVMSPEGFTALSTSTLRIVIAVLSIFLIFLSYITAVSIDNRIQEYHLEKAGYAG